jgi:hypothetical protein
MTREKILVLSKVVILLFSFVYLVIQYSSSWNVAVSDHSNASTNSSFWGPDAFVVVLISWPGSLEVENLREVGDNIELV